MPPSTPSPRPPVPKRSLAVRILRGAAKTLGVVSLLVVLLVAGALASLDTPPGRRLVLKEINGVLGPSFQGKITIHRMAHIGIMGVSGVDATVTDPSGREVASVTGVRVGIATLAAVRSALLGKKAPLTVDLTGVSIDSADVLLDTDAAGNLELLNAFAPPPNKPSAPPDPNARGFRIDISRITLSHSRGHGQMAGAPFLDVDLDDVHAAFSYAPDALEANVDGARVLARRIASGADVAGTLQAHLRKPSDENALPEGRLVWNGKVGDIAQSIHGSFVNQTIDAVVDVPSASPDGIRALWSDSPIDRPAQLHVEAHGPLAGVHVLLHAILGAATFDADGHVVAEGEKTAKVDLRAHGIDVHEFAKSAPTSRLGLTGTVSASQGTDGTLSADAALRFLGGDVGDTVAPPAVLRANGSKNKANEVNASADVSVEEPGAPTHLSARLVSKGSSSTLHFQLDTTAEDFQKVPQLAHKVNGSAQMTAAGDVDLSKEKIDAQVHARAADVVQGDTRVNALSVEATARGPLSAPNLDVKVHAADVALGGRRFTSADVTAKGSALNPHVDVSVRGPDTPDLDATGDIGLQNGVSVASLRVDLARAEDKAHVTVRSMRFEGGDLRVDDARIEGLGAPLTASFSQTPATMRIQAKTTGIDLARVARLAHLEKRLQDGTLAFDTDLHLQRASAEGRLVLDGGQVNTAEVKGASAHVDLSFAGRTVKGVVHADAPAIGVLDLNVPKVTWGGAGALAAAGWKQASGSVDVDLHADLGKLTALIPPEDLPVSEAHGTVALKAHVARAGAYALTPDVTVNLDTDKLVLAPRVSMERDIDGVLVHPNPPWRLFGIDFAIDGAFDGKTGALRLSTGTHDTGGPLAQLDVSSKHFPAEDLIRDNGRWATDLRTTEFDVSLAVPERGLGTMPPLLKQAYVTGKMQAKVAVLGTMAVPRVDVSVALRHAGFGGHKMTSPMDLDVAAHYDDGHATGTVKATSDGHELLALETKIEVAAARLLDGTGEMPPWTASAHAHMAAFPLQAISALDDKLVAGSVTGNVSIDGLHEDAHLDADFAVDQLSVGSIPYKGARIVAKADGHAIEGSLRIDQIDGYAEAKAKAAASWGDALSPALDPSQPLNASLTAKNLRVAAFLPFVDGTLDELDGRLDTNAQIELDPRSKGAKLSGTMALTRGTIEAAAGGGELHDITAHVKFDPDGTITLEKLTAAGVNGKLEVAGNVHLQGTSLQSAKASITIPNRSAIPLTVGGVELGNIDGRIDVTAAAGPNNGPLALKVDVPKLDVKLSESATNSPQSLGPFADNVRVGAHRGDPVRFVLLPLDPEAEATKASGSAGGGAVIATHLGDVHVVRGTQVVVDLEGNVNVKAGGTTSITGQIHLKKGGTLDVEGRTFEVESGTVTFVDDPGNPQVVVKAGWTGPDGTIVYATFTGPLKTGKVTLTSEPQLPKEEIVQLLLFGSAEGKQAQTPSSSTENSAIATAGGEAAQPLNHMLNQLGLGAVTAKVDTSDSATPKPEVEVQIAKDISLQIAVVLGVPPPGVNPDRTLITLDWRILSKWSLATTVGDAGTTIFDLLWQRRY